MRRASLASPHSMLTDKHADAKTGRSFLYPGANDDARIHAARPRRRHVARMVFGASSLYLVLKVGITVSASIPVAVISLTLFRMWSKVGGRDATHSRKQHRPDHRLGR